MFRVYLPEMVQWVDAGAVTAPDRDPATPTPTAPASNRGRCILLVDDEPVVRMAIQRRLEIEGFEVLVAGNGIEALRVMEQSHRRIGGVVTDFTMPEMDGPTLAPLLRVMAPTVPIIGVSGRDQESRVEELHRLGFAEILNKPFESSALIAALRRQMG